MGYLQHNNFMSQIFIGSLIWLCCPGVIEILKSIHYPTEIHLETYDTINIVQNVTSCVFPLIGALIYNIYGRFVLIPASLTCVLLAGSYISTNGAFYITANTLYSIGISILYVIISGIVISYPDEKNKGKAFSLNCVISSLGIFISNIIDFIQERKISYTDASNTSNIITMIIMAAGSLITLLLLPANKVKRANGSVVSLHKPSNWMRECIELLNLFKNWRLLILAPLFFSSGWTLIYHMHVFNLYYHTSLHKRLTITLLHQLFSIIGGVCTGFILDAKFLGFRKRRGFIINIFALIFATSLWVGCIVIQNRSHDNDDGSLTVIDLEDEKYSGYIVIYILSGILYSIQECLIYWLLGTMTNDTERAVRYMGFFQAIQGAAIPIAILLAESLVNLKYQFIISFVIQVCSIIISLFVCRKITDVTIESVDNLIIDEQKVIMVGGEIKDSNVTEDYTPLKNEV